jgi:putative membrane protein
MRKMMRAAACVIVLLFAANSYAHGDEAHEVAEVLGTWTFDPWVVICLSISAIVYIVGVQKLWASSKRGSGISVWSAAAFAAGWVSLVIALISPVHAWGEVLFSAHMTQHEILMLISAPLMVLGRPMIAAMWAMPMSWRGEVGSIVNLPSIKRPWRFITHPGVAWAIHAAALWIWHIPYLFQATITSELVHAFQHISFFGSAVLFWWAMVNESRGLASYGAGILYLFTTSIHSGLLGAFLTFTHRVLYPVYEGSTAQWGLTPIEDQQLGGLIMWVPASLVYIAAALFMFVGWLRASENSVLRRERQFDTAFSSET